MATSETHVTGPPSPGWQVPPALRAYWPLLAGLLVIGIPTMVTLGQQVWNTEAGAHGPIVLATGIWLMTQSRDSLTAQSRPDPLWLWLPALAITLAVYIFGRAYDLILIEAAGLYGTFIAMAMRLVGLRAIWSVLFPFVYFAFLVPLPGWVLDVVTVPLREFVSMVSTDGLRMVGYPIAREGVTIQIAQYQLLVEDACSGMNSMVGLIAISMFYIYMLHRASWRRSLALLAFIIPVAILTNIIRVIILILLTYHYGDAVAQGFLHVTAGMLVFAVALALMVLIDIGLSRLSAWRRGSAT